jgi:cysteine desulfuration protein SufE
MSGIRDITYSLEQRALVEEYHALPSAEDRLTWLMEREPTHFPIPSENRVAERKVPGCLSGLWLDGEVGSHGCQFRAFSESDMVQGIVSFICDLYSSRPPEEVLEIGTRITDGLGLERLLSTTRRRAVSGTLSYILHTAREALPVENVA